MDVNACTSEGSTKGEETNASRESVLDFIGPRIEELCAKKHITKYRLAQCSGVSATDITRYVHGIRMPAVTTIEKLCAGLGISLSEFFENAPSQAPLPEEDSLDTLLDIWDRLDPAERKNFLSFGKYLVQGTKD